MYKKQIKVLTLAAALLLGFNISAVQAQVAPSAPTQPVKKASKKPVKKAGKTAGKTAKKPVKKAAKKSAKKPVAKAHQHLQAKTAKPQLH